MQKPHKVSRPQYHPDDTDLVIRRLEDECARAVSAKLSAEEQIQKLEKDIEHLNNLPIKSSIKQLMKAVYRSIRFRALKLIWGSTAGYKDTQALSFATDMPLDSVHDADKALKIINAADAINTPLLFRTSPVRQFIFELLRKIVIGLRKLIRRQRN